MTLDPPTVFVLLIASTFANSVILIWSWGEYRNEPSLLLTAIGFAVAGAGAVLLAGRSQLPAFIAIDVANALVLFSQWMVWAVVRAFNHGRANPWTAVGAVALMFALFQIPVIVESFGLRTLVASVPSAFFCLVAAREVLVADGLKTRVPLATVLLIHAVFLLARVITSLAIQPATSLRDFEGPWFLPFALETLVFVQFMSVLILALIKERSEDQQRQLRLNLEEAYLTLQRDFDAAAAVQQALIPGSCQCDQIRFGSLLRASRFISGDTFNVFEPSPNRIVFFAVDVAGHGAAAALVSVTAHNELTELARNRPADESLDSVIATLNETWSERLPYFTMILGEIDVVQRKGRLVQAGHPPALLISSNGDISTVGSGGTPIGLVTPGSYDTVEFLFEPGDRLFIYSDGVTEAARPDGTMFSEERLVEMLRSNNHGPIDDIIHKLESTLVSWRGVDQFDDDVSLIVIERLGQRHS